jgi:hypothetical protein
MQDNRRLVTLADVLKAYGVEHVQQVPVAERVASV